MIVGAVSGWLSTKGVNLNDDSMHLITLVVEGAFGLTYYGIVRGLEHLNYRFGWLLGYAKMPTYVVLPAADSSDKSE
jgi:hypothetical protein